jgi:hypothetical protein
MESDHGPIPDPAFGWTVGGKVAPIALDLPVLPTPGGLSGRTPAADRRAGMTQARSAEAQD